MPLLTPSVCYGEVYISFFFFLFNLKACHLPAAWKTEELPEKLLPILAEQVSLVCVRGEASYWRSAVRRCGSLDCFKPKLLRLGISEVQCHASSDHGVALLVLSTKCALQSSLRPVCSSPCWGSEAGVVQKREGLLPFHLNREQKANSILQSSLYQYSLYVAFDLP